jgi:hypothetical protein
MPLALMTPRLEHAFRWAAVCHQGQVRKGNDTPYFQHVAAVETVALMSLSFKSRGHGFHKRVPRQVFAHQFAVGSDHEHLG